MIGRLVEQQHIGWTHQHFGHCIPIALSAAQHTELLEDIVARKHEAPEQTPQLHYRHLRRRPRNVVQHLGVAVEHLVLILRKVIREHVMAQLDRSRRGLLLPAQHPDQRRLTRAVRPHQGNSVSTINLKRHILQDRFDSSIRRRVLLREARDLDHGASARRRLRNRETDRGLLLWHHNPLNLFKLLDPRLHLLGLGRLRPEAIDKRLQIADALALILIRIHQLRLALFFLCDVLLIAAGVHVHPLIPDFANFAYRHIEKIAVMRDQHKGVLIVAQVIFKPVARLEIQVVRRLIEQQQGWLLEQQLGQRNPHLPAARKLLGAPLPVFFRKPQPSQHRAHLRVERIDVMGLQHVHDVRVAIRRLLVFRRPRLLVAQGPRQLFGLGLHAAQLVKDAQTLFKDGLAAHGQPVLRQIPERRSLVLRNGPVIERLHPGQYLQQRAFAGAVAADEPRPLVGRDQPVHLLEQEFHSKSFARA